MLAEFVFLLSWIFVVAGAIGTMLIAQVMPWWAVILKLSAFTVVLVVLAKVQDYWVYSSWHHALVVCLMISIMFSSLYDIFLWVGVAIGLASNDITTDRWTNPRSRK